VRIQTQRLSIFQSVNSGAYLHRNTYSEVTTKALLQIPLEREQDFTGKLNKIDSAGEGI
jgi:hypothetical protein